MGIHPGHVVVPDDVLGQDAEHPREERSGGEDQGEREPPGGPRVESPPRPFELAGEVPAGGPNKQNGMEGQAKDQRRPRGPGRRCGTQGFA